MSGCVGGFRSAFCQADAPVTHPLPPEYLYWGGKSVLKNKSYSSKPVEQNMAGETKRVRGWITTCCRL